MHFITIVLAASACSIIQPSESGSNLSSSAIFAPGVISTNDLEYSITFEPDCRTLYFSRRDGDWGGNNSNEPVILESHWRNGAWSEPTVVSFLGEYGNDDPFVTLDGKYLYFVSNRPKKQNAEIADDDIWRIERVGDKWGSPERLPEPVNSAGREFSPVLGSSGTIYFSSDREGGLGQGDIYAASADGKGGYSVQALSDAVNSPWGEWNVGVNAKETILIIEASQRETNLSSYGDLYVSYRDSAEHQWSKGKPIAKLNTTGSNLMPRFTPDEAYLFYGNTDTKESRDANITYVKTESALKDTSSKEYIAVANRSEHVISLIDPTSYKVITKIESGKGPHEVAEIANGFVTSSYGVYNDISDARKTPRRLKFKFDPSDGIVLYNVSNKQRIALSLEDCVRPHGITSSPDGSRFWITCEEELALAEIDAKTGAELTRWNTQQTGSHIVVYDEKRDRLYVANVDAGSVTLINRKSREAKVIKTGAGAEGLALTDKGDQLWVTNTQANTISVVNLKNDQILTTFGSGGRFPVKLRQTPDGAEVWVTQNNSNELTVFETKTRKIVKIIPLESAPLGLLISPSGDRVFVTLPRIDRVDVFDAHTKERITSFSPGIEPDGLAWVTAE